jgi:hypothetical protein
MGKGVVAVVSKIFHTFECSDTPILEINDQGVKRCRKAKA